MGHHSYTISTAPSVPWGTVSSIGTAPLVHHQYHGARGKSLSSVILSIEACTVISWGCVKLSLQVVSVTVNVLYGTKRYSSSPGMCVISSTNACLHLYIGSAIPRVSTATFHSTRGMPSDTRSANDVATILHRLVAKYPGTRYFFPGTKKLWNMLLNDPPRYTMPSLGNFSVHNFSRSLALASSPRCTTRLLIPRAIITRWIKSSGSSSRIAALMMPQNSTPPEPH